MTIEEIKQAIANGLTVKFQNSLHTVKQDKDGNLYADYKHNDTKKQLKAEDLENCFI